MSVLSDTTIRELSLEKGMIHPFVDGQVKERDGKKIPSYGLSSYGYDIRLAETFYIFNNVNHTVIDPLEPIGDEAYTIVEGKSCILPPNSYLLAHTVESFNIPRDVLSICLGKSTWARSGIAINVTPIEPTFRGQVVIEIANQTTLPVRIHAGVGFCQFIFLTGDKPCEVGYGDRSGKYQDQTGVTTVRL